MLFKAKKNKQILFTSIKVILFLGIGFLLYNQINSIDTSQWEEFELEYPIYIVIALLFMPVNQLMEFLKWKSTIDAIGMTTDRSTRWNSFLAGVVAGMLTPNMIGNFLGRMFYFQRRSMT